MQIVSTLETVAQGNTGCITDCTPGFKLSWSSVLALVGCHQGCCRRPCVKSASIWLRVVLNITGSGTALCMGPDAGAAVACADAWPALPAAGLARFCLGFAGACTAAAGMSALLACQTTSCCNLFFRASESSALAFIAADSSVSCCSVPIAATA